MTLLAPALARLLEAGERFAAGSEPAADLKEAVAEARAFVAEGRQLHDLLAPGILRTPRVLEALSRAEQELEAQQAALDALEEAWGRAGEAGVRDACRRLVDASRGLAEAYAAIQEEEHRQLVYSPYPVIDHFIKTGINVLDGHVPPGRLLDRFPAVIDLVQRLARDVERYRALFGSSPALEAARQSVESLQAGVGAGIETFRESNRSALPDCLKLLGAFSTALREELAAAERGVRERCEFSSHLYLEQLYRARHRYLRGQVPRRMVEEALQICGDYLEFYASEIEAVREFPLFFLLEQSWKPAREALEGVSAALEKARNRDPRELPMEELRIGFDRLLAGIEALWDRLEEEMVRLEGAPALEELREMVGRVLQGRLPPGALQARLAHHHQVQERLAAEVREARVSGGLEPALAEELERLLGLQGSGYREMLEALPTGDRARLRRGWSLVEGPVPRLAELAGQLRRQVGEAAGPATVRCLHCGIGNPPQRRYCQSCSAVLPVAAEGPREYTDITGGAPAEGAVPAHLERLEELAGLVESGGIEPQAAAAEIEEILSTALEARRTFGSQVAPRVARDDILACYARRFEEHLSRFVEGLEVMRQGAAAGAPARVHQGLQLSRQAGEGLLELKRAIDAAGGGMW